MAWNLEKVVRRIPDLPGKILLISDNLTQTPSSQHFDTRWVSKGAKKIRKKEGEKKEQGRIHGGTVANGWAGVVMQKPLAIQKCYGRTDRHGKV